jgi:branched-chain amino acid transport system permease protein
MELFLQRVVDGIQNGAIYAALALAIVLIFRATGLLNFAQGEMAMFSTFLTWVFASNGWPIVLAVLASMVLSFIGGAVIELVVLRPVEKSSPLAIVIVTIGLFLSINAFAGWYWGYDGKQLDSPFPDERWEIGGVVIRASAVGNMIVLGAVAIILFALFQKTKIGLAMRAASSSPESSGLVGIPVGRMLMLGWGMAAALGALAGALIAPLLTGFDPNLMQGVLIYGFAAATLGGFDSPLGAIVGGLIVGLTESLVAGYFDIIGSELKLATAFFLILGVLLIKPTGLFGHRVVERV